MDEVYSVRYTKMLILCKYSMSPPRCLYSRVKTVSDRKNQYPAVYIYKPPLVRGRKMKSGKMLDI